VDSLSAKALAPPPAEEAEAAAAARAAAEADLAGALRVVAMAATSCPAVLPADKLGTVLTVLLHPAVRRRMLFPVALGCAQCLQSLPAGLCPASAAAGADADGSVAAVRSLVLGASEGLCLLLVGDYVQEDSPLSRCVCVCAVVCAVCCAMCCAVVCAVLCAV
jgi:hypothetical protein